MARVTGGGAGVSVDKIVKFSTTVSSEEAQLKFLKNVLGTQVRARIILFTVCNLLFYEKLVYLSL